MYGVILIGYPGSGKSTLGKALAEIRGLEYISSGDIARKMAENDIGAKHNLAIGKLAPEYLMRDKICRAIKGCINNDVSFVLDGFPRFVEQDQWLKDNFREVHFIYVEVRTSDNIFTRIFKRSRDDISATDIRVQYYLNNTVDILVNNTHTHVQNDILKTAINQLVEEYDNIANHK